LTPTFTFHSNNLSNIYIWYCVLCFITKKPILQILLGLYSRHFDKKILNFCWVCKFYLFVCFHCFLIVSSKSCRGPHTVFNYNKYLFYANIFVISLNFVYSKLHPSSRDFGHWAANFIEARRNDKHSKNQFDQKIVSLTSKWRKCSTILNRKLCKIHFLKKNSLKNCLNLFIYRMNVC
jgi:hypothetical protein